MAFEIGHVALKVAARQKLAFDERVANIVDEVPQDRLTVMAERIGAKGECVIVNYWMP
jgi:hypothetical protein